MAPPIRANVATAPSRVGTKSFSDFGLSTQEVVSFFNDDDEDDDDDELAFGSPPIAV